jgi:hypothetical protein
LSGKTNPDRDVRVKILLDPETALKALLAVNPDDEPVDDEDDVQVQRKDRTDQ